MPFGVEGYDGDADSSRVKDDMDVFGRGVWSGASCNCDSAGRRSGKLENDSKEIVKKQPTNNL